MSDTDLKQEHFDSFLTNFRSYANGYGVWKGRKLFERLVIECQFSAVTLCRLRAALEQLGVLQFNREGSNEFWYLDRKLIQVTFRHHQCVALFLDGSRKSQYVL